MLIRAARPFFRFQLTQHWKVTETSRSQIKYCNSQLSMFICHEWNINLNVISSGFYLKGTHFERSRSFWTNFYESSVQEQIRLQWEKKKSHEFHLLCSKTSQILSQRKTKLDLIFADEHFFFFFFKSPCNKSIDEMDREFPSKSTKSIIKRKSDGIVI